MRICGLRHNIFLFSATLSHATNKWKSFNCEISSERKYLDSGLRNSHKKDFEYTKHPREKISNPRNTYDKNVPTKYRRKHNGTIPMRLTMAHDARNLAHPIKRYVENFCQVLCRNLFLINLQAYSLPLHLKKIIWQRCFPNNSANFLRIFFADLQETVSKCKTHSWWRSLS